VGSCGPLLEMQLIQGSTKEPTRPSTRGWCPCFDDSSSIRIEAGRNGLIPVRLQSYRVAEETVLIKQRGPEASGGEFDEFIASVLSEKRNSHVSSASHFTNHPRGSRLVPGSSSAYTSSVASANRSYA
jgi:hypothetical protein